MNSKSNEEKWINTDEASSYLGVKPATLRGWIKKYPTFPSSKIGKCWKFKKSELEQWVKNNKK